MVGSGAGGGAMRKSAKAGPDHARAGREQSLGERGKGNWEWQGGNRRGGGKEKDK